MSLPMLKIFPVAWPLHLMGLGKVPVNWEEVFFGLNFPYLGEVGQF